MENSHARIDDAFNWFVLILGTLSGTLIGFPDILSTKIIFAGSLIPPMLILIFIWLWSYLAEKMEYKVILKSSAWFLAFNILFFDALAFIYIAYPQIAVYIGNGIGVLIILAYYVIPFIVYILAVRPKYRSIFKDSRILRSVPLLVLLYFLVHLGSMPFMIDPSGLSRLL